MTASSSGRSRPPVPGRWRRAAILVFGVVLFASLAACGAGGAPAPVGAPLEGEQDRQDGDSQGYQPGGDTSDEGTASFANLGERHIVKTGEVTIEVESVAATVGALRALALDMGGYVGGSQAGDPDDPATLTLRIPADRFDSALERIHEMDGEVRAEATREEDVTGSVVDLEARIRNLQASETQYRALLDRATEIEDILTVQSRLDEVRGRIEQLQAQLDQLAGQAGLATLTVTVVPAAAPVEETAAGWDAGAIFDSALAALVGLGQALATVGIWLAILGLPLAVALGIVAAIALRLAPGFRRRVASEEGASTGPME